MLNGLTESLLLCVSYNNRREKRAIIICDYDSVLSCNSKNVSDFYDAESLFDQYHLNNVHSLGLFY